MKCGVCSAELAESDLIHIEGRQVCGSCKPLVVQQLKEGCLPPPPPLPSAEHPVENGGELLRFGSLMVLSWKMLWQDWRAILGITVLTAIPVNVLLQLAAPISSGEELVAREFVRLVKMGTLLETLIGVVASLGIAYVISERVEGRRTGFGAALRHALSRWLPAMGTGLLESIIVGFLTLLLIVPGIIWFVFYTFSICVVSLRDRSGTRALYYSKMMVQGRWWAVAGRVLGLTFLPMGATFFIGVGFAFAPDEPLLSLLSDILTDLLFAYLVVGVVVLFLNLEAVERKKETAGCAVLTN